MKCALVTGGSRGIGRAVCVKMAQMGYYVIINYKGNTAAANEALAMVNATGSNGELLQFDVANKEEIQQVLAGWMERNTEKYIEVLVNNAGIKDDGLMMWMKDEQWENVIETSLGGFFYVTRARSEQHVVEKIWPHHQCCFPFRLKRSAGTNKLFGCKGRRDRCYQSPCTGSWPQGHYGKRSSTRLYQNRYDRRIG